jgi:hypothetical protein
VHAPPVQVAASVADFFDAAYDAPGTAIIAANAMAAATLIFMLMRVLPRGVASTPNAAHHAGAPMNKS